MNIFDSRKRKLISRRYLRDIKNTILYWSLAPKTNQLIYLDPDQIKTVVEKNLVMAEPHLKESTLA
jgi:hypothetical protein